MSSAEETSPEGEKGKSSRLDVETAKTALRELLDEIPAFREFATRPAGKGKKRMRDGGEEEEEAADPPPNRRARSGPVDAGSSSDHEKKR